LHESRELSPAQILAWADAHYARTGLTHTAYHIGQIVYLSRLLKKEGWQWITIPPGQSQVKDRGGKYLK
jgi:hypothetical protein